MKKAALNTHARSLRRDQTDAEKKLWRCLRSRQFKGFKFRRQQPVGPYIADFCSFEGKIVIELDGGHHSLEAQKDSKRTHYLEEKGYRVIRFWNNEVLVHLDSVMLRILEDHLLSPSPYPLPRGGEGKPFKTN